MRTKIQKLFNLNNFFKIISSNQNGLSFKHEEASKIILQNIRVQWLQFIFAKTHQHIPIFIEMSKAKEMGNSTKPFGYINQNIPEYKDQVMEFDLERQCCKQNSELSLTIIVPTHDIMPYFMQWQRYRKYWWSSITTTPSLFNISDIKDNGKSANANIMANFNWGMNTVETLTIDVKSDTKMSSLKCLMTPDDALITLLLDGLSNKTKEEYLRLHNKIAPYKIALALDCQDSENYNKMKELAALIMHKLKVKNISTRCPNLSAPLDLQLTDNFKIGVTYTAIITEDTLNRGILQLLNSSTMLKEHLHLVDFDSYAALLCGK